MSRRKPSLISIAGEETVIFRMHAEDGRFQTLSSHPLEEFLEGGAEVGELPKVVSQSVNRLLVVPDYWVGSRFDAFQARKKSVIAAFIERKLKLEQPTLTEAADFYNYAIFDGQDHRRQLYTFYLQEAVAYRLYQRLAALGISPLRMTTPALLWQTKLADVADGFSRQGVGLIHLGESDCFLYFYFRGQFLFSRTIQLPDSGGDASQVYDLLNFEINQSFYLYSQKTKSTVDALFMLASDPAAAPRLTELLGREVTGLPGLPPPSGIPEDGMIPPECRIFSVADVMRTDLLTISYKPLKKEMYWRPVQWAGIAVGLLLVVFLAVESAYLYSLSASADRQMIALKSAGAEPPELVLQNVSLAIDEISRALQQPSGGGTVMRALMAMPDAVTMDKLVLDVSGTPHLTFSAVVHADNPDTFKKILRVFLDRLNDRFDLKTGALLEKDVRISLDRGEGHEKTPIYRIDFGLELSS